MHNHDEGMAWLCLNHEGNIYFLSYWMAISVTIAFKSKLLLKYSVKFYPMMLTDSVIEYLFGNFIEWMQDSFDPITCSMGQKKTP